MFFRRFIEYLREKVSWSIVNHSLYLVLLLGIVVFTVFGDSGLYKLHSLYQSKKDLDHQIKESGTQIERLEMEKKRLVNPEYIESIIRKELGYIKPGEVVYQINK